MNLSNEIKRLVIKSYDSAIYLSNRALIRYYFYKNILRKALVLRGRIERILVVRLASIGDVVRATAVVKALKAKYPQATIDFLTTRVTLPVLKDNPRLGSIYTLEDLPFLPTYDWMINLQRVAPPPSFLEGADQTFEEILRFLSYRVTSKVITGRHFQAGRESSCVNLFHCRTEMEELFLSALLPYSHARVADTEINLNGDRRKVLREFGLPPGDKLLGIFLGTNSSGGDDGGQRTYSIEFVEKLANSFTPGLTIVIVGQSSYKTADEKARYDAFIKSHPNVIDLVDKTNLEELLYVIKGLKLFISCDSGPLHIAMALGVPVIGLYVNAADFRIAPWLRGERYILINAFDVCFDFSWRWKFHCLACQERHSYMYGCNLKKIDNKIDRIPLGRIRAAASDLLKCPIDTFCDQVSK
jgi:ADP-heptose:LPS heptosyltransferase